MFFFFWDKNELPSFDQLMKPLVSVLKELDKPSSIEEIDNAVIELMSLPEEMIILPHNDDSTRTEISYRLAWARTYLKKYGIITNITRGVWKLSEKFDGNIENLDIEEIKRSVRNTNVEKNNNNKNEEKNLTGFESAQAFEKLVVSLIQDLASNQKKSCIMSYSDQFDIGIDLILPEGIDDYSEQIDCVIKYVNPNRGNKNQDFLDILKNLDFRSKKVLYVTNVTIEDNAKASIENNVIVWDKIVLSKKIDPEKPYTKYIINAKEALIKDIVSSTKSGNDLDSRNKVHIENVRKAYKNEDMSLFLGAGVSLDGGIPLWSTLIKHLHISMINQLSEDDNLDSKMKEMLIKLATYNGIDSPLLQMRYIKSAFTDKKYYELVYSVMYEKEENIETELLNGISKICTPQRAYCGVKNVITYNFDDLVESKLEAKEIKFNIIADENSRQLFDKLNIYHVHGFLPRNNKYTISESGPDLIFSEEDYHRVYRDSFSWSNLVQLNALRENTCLFIGCSLTDPNLRRLLDVAISDGEEPRHYAFMKKNSIKLDDDLKKNITQEVLDTYQRIDDNIQTAYYEQLGINIIWIDGFNEIPKILNSLDV